MRPSTRDGITLNIQQRYVADFTLKPSNIAETVNVTSDAVALQTQEASLGGVVQSKAINDLPLNGRNYTFLAQLNAGVVQAQQDTRGMGGNGSFSANGQNSFANNYLLDGVDNNSNLVDFVNGAGYVYRPSVDALQEFKVQTSSYSAELGRASGAVLNASLKSGGEQYRGNLFEFYPKLGDGRDQLLRRVPGPGEGQVQPQSVRLHPRWSAVVPSTRRQADVLFHQLRGHHCPPGGHLDIADADGAHAAEQFHRHVGPDSAPARYAHRPARPDVPARDDLRSRDDAADRSGRGRPGDRPNRHGRRGGVDSRSARSDRQQPDSCQPHESERARGC